MPLGFEKFKPMLAAPAKIEKLKFPLAITPKLDGIRCITTEEGSLSRTLKQIPNKNIQAAMVGLPPGLDGELVYLNAEGKVDFSRTTSVVMSHDKPVRTEEYSIVFYAFDYITPETVNLTYMDRMEQMYDVLCDSSCNLEVVGLYNPQTVNNLEGLQKLHTQYVQSGFEGTMARTPDSPYKFGRSTANQGWLVKFKDFIDAEATVVGFVERRHHIGEAVTNALGHAERDSKKDNFEGADTLGAIVLLFTYTKTEKVSKNLTVYEGDTVEFEVGTGFDHALAQEIWDNREDYVGKHVKFQYFEIGSKGKPRIPSFLGFRDERDMGDVATQEVT